MAKVDYAYKAYVLKEHSDLLHKCKQASKLTYAKTEFEENGTIMPILERSNGNIQDMVELSLDCENQGLKREFLECIKINNASYKRVQRLRERVSRIVSNPNGYLFLTMTFTNDVLNNTSATTRRRYVRDFLSSISDDYVGNIDFGSHNDYIDDMGEERTGTDREHYHAIVNVGFLDNTGGKLWNYGSLNFRSRYFGDDDLQTVRISKYVTKLSNHAIKESTKRCALIFPRSKHIAVQG